MGVNSGNLVEERFGVVFVEAEESEVLAGGGTRHEQELLRRIAERVDGHALEALLDCRPRHGLPQRPPAVLGGNPGPGGPRSWAAHEGLVEGGECVLDRRRRVVGEGREVLLKVGEGFLEIGDAVV